MRSYADSEYIFGYQTMTLTAATMSKLDWEIGDIQSNQKGVKSGPISKKGSLVFLSLANSLQPLTTPFGASAFNDEQATRKNICFRCSPSLVEKLNKIDSYMTQYIDRNSNRLFKNKKVTYKPLLVPQKDDYPPLIRCKVNTAGQKVVRCWDADQARCDLPEDLRACTLVPRVHFRSLWVMGDNCGITCNVTDLMCFPIDEECPFSNEE